MRATTKKPTKLPHTENIMPLVQKDNILKDYNMPESFKRELKLI